MWLISLLLFQDYIQWGTIIPIIFFIGLIIYFLIKQYAQDEKIKREQEEKRNH